MASWGSPRSYRDNSPISRLTPLSPRALPQWLRPSRPPSGIFSNGRLKIIFMASLCLLLGWMVTTALGPGDDFQQFDTSYDVASGGVLNDPSGFGVVQKTKKRPGIITDDEEDLENALGNVSKGPSVKGALADLHHAVSDKIQSWNPYSVKSAHQKGGPLSSNNTAKSNNTKNTTFLGGESVRDGIKEEDRLGARVRIGKCTILFRGNDFWERCLRTHEQHDRHQGYRLHVLRQEIMDDVWSKPAYILSLLLRELAKPQSERLDWLLWVDSDTIILNPYIPVETFLPPQGTEFDDVYLMYSNDWNGLNNGVFPVRVNQWAARLFAAIVAYRHYKPEDPLQFRDQSAMNTLMQEPEFAKHIIQAPQRWFNAYQGEHNETLQPFQIRRGDLLVHFAGVGGREQRMQWWLERAEQHLEDWEVPVKSTSYPQEARDFWTDQRALRRDKAEKLRETREKAAQLITTTDQRLASYGDRLSDEQKTKINEQREALQKLIDQSDDKEKVLEGMKTLSEAVTPLTIAITDANKLLLQSAHEAIFGGEKDLLEGKFGQGRDTSDLARIATTVKTLKSLIMVPEDSWNRSDITAATNSLTDARAKLQAKAAAEVAAQKQAVEEQVARAKALEEAKMAVEAEAAALQPVSSTASPPEATVGVEIELGAHLSGDDVAKEQVSASNALSTSDPAAVTASTESTVIPAVPG